MNNGMNFLQVRRIRPSPNEIVPQLLQPGIFIWWMRISFVKYFNETTIWFLLILLFKSSSAITTQAGLVPISNMHRKTMFTTILAIAILAERDFPILKLESGCQIHHMIENLALSFFHRKIQQRFFTNKNKWSHRYRNMELLFISVQDVFISFVILFTGTRMVNDSKLLLLLCTN